MVVGSEKNRVGSEVGSSQNQPPPADPPASTSRSRKRGLSALLQDVTNTDQMECSEGQERSGEPEHGLCSTSKSKTWRETATDCLRR